MGFFFGLEFRSMFYLFVFIIIFFIQRLQERRGQIVDHSNIKTVQDSSAEKDQNQGKETID